MKKIPCLFQRDFVPRANGRGKDVILRRDVTVGCEPLLDRGLPTIKWDGSACAVIEISSAGEGVPADGYMPWVPMPLRSSWHLFRRYEHLFRRYDAKQGKAPPPGAIPCDEPDPETGHHPHWILVGEGPEDRWLREAYLRHGSPLPQGTYEFVGPHVQSNPYLFTEDKFVRHGGDIIADLAGKALTFDILRDYLEVNLIEGIVFWMGGWPRAKIRRKDFGFKWPEKKS